MQLLRLKEVMILLSFTFGAALLRIPMQSVPSAEPITFFAILAGWLFGKYKGAALGAGSLYLSNFFMFGGQGSWTPFQAAGFAVAGYLGGFLRSKAKWWECAVVAAGSTIIFDIIMNSFTIITGGGVFLTFFLALPFLAVHLISNLLFSLFLPFAKRKVFEKGKFDEKEICMDALSRLGIGTRSKFPWLPGRKR